LLSSSRVYGATAISRRLTPSVVFELHSADRLVRAIVYEELDRVGLRPNLLAILVLIELHQPVTPTELAYETGVAPTTLRDMVNEMIDRGHLRRVENKEDGRSHFLEVTAEGRRFIAQAGKAVRAAEERIERELGVQLEELREPLSQMRRAAREALARETAISR
jgi:DNA-binding MarR family transcriptional regulator